MADSPATIYDVAALAGVSIATVSRAINSLDSVRPATRDKVLAGRTESKELIARLTVAIETPASAATS